VPSLRSWPTVLDWASRDKRHIAAAVALLMLSLLVLASLVGLVLGAGSGFFVGLWLTGAWGLLFNIVLALR